MGYHTKVFTLKSTTNDTSILVNPDHMELTSITLTEEGEFSVMSVQAGNVIRFNIREDDIEKFRDALRGVDNIELDAEYLAFESNR